MERELTKAFPMASLLGSSWISWIQSIIEECLGDLPTIEAYLKTMGWTVQAWMQKIIDWLVAHYKASHATRDMEEPAMLDVNGKTCQSAFAAVTDNAQCARIATAMAKHPILARIIERQCLKAYQVANPGVTAIDWSAIIAWIIANCASLFGG